jgi:hypothetical protein
MFRDRLKPSASRRYCLASIVKSDSVGAKFKMSAATEKTSN